MITTEQLNWLNKAINTTCKLMKSSNILSVKGLTKLEMSKFMYKYSNDLLPKPLANIITKSTHDYETRNQNVPPIQIHPNTIYNKSFLVKCIKEWLRVPLNIKVKPSLKCFSKHMKNGLKTCGLVNTP